MLVPGAVLYALRTLGMIDTGDRPEYIFKPRVALESLLLSLVLAYRVRYARTRPENEEPRKLEIIRDTQQIAQSTIDDIRRISHQLHPHVLDRLGLKEAIIQVVGNGVDKAKRSSNARLKASIL